MGQGSRARVHWEDQRTDKALDWRMASHEAQVGASSFLALLKLASTTPAVSLGFRAYGFGKPATRITPPVT